MIILSNILTISKVKDLDKLKKIIELQNALNEIDKKKRAIVLQN